MRTIRFEFKVPDWVPTPQDIKFAWRGFKYKLNPFRCERCNVKMNFKFPEYHGEPRPYQRLAIHNHGKSLCPTCLLDSIKQHFASVKKKQTKEACTCCGEKKQTVDIIWGLGDNNKSDIDVRFLTRWWNGNPVCLDCITDVLENNPKGRSGHLYLQGNTVHCINERGALIK